MKQRVDINKRSRRAFSIKSWVLPLCIVAAAWGYKFYKDGKFDFLKSENTLASRSSAPQMEEKVVEIEHRGYRTLSFIASPSSVVEIEVESVNGVKVDCFVVPDDPQTIHYFASTTKPSSSNTLLFEEEILMSKDRVRFSRSGRYVMILRHGHFNNNPLDRDYRPAQLRYRFTLY